MMTKSDQPKISDAAKADSVHCRRTGQQYNSEEHLRCPYCFGNKADIQAGKQAEFCDYDPEKDPVNFGFPEDSSRNLRN